MLYLCIDPGLVNLAACYIHAEGDKYAILWSQTYRVQGGHNPNGYPDPGLMHIALANITEGDETLPRGARMAATLLIEQQLKPVMAYIAGWCMATASVGRGFDCHHANMGAIKRKLGIATGNYYRNKREAERVAREILGSAVASDHEADCVLMAHHYNTMGR